MLRPKLNPLFLLFLLSPVAVYGDAFVNLNARATFKCQGKTIFQAGKKGLKPVAFKTVSKKQNDAISSLKAKLKTAKGSKKKAIQAQLKAEQALLSNFQLCNKGKLIPKTPTPLTVVRPISVGSAHVCGITSDGFVYCWGRGDFGQLGSGKFTNSSVPVKVAGISRAVAVAAGEKHTCAVLEDRTVKCWGANYNGQFGTGSSSNTLSATPVSVPGLSDAIDIASGSDHLCVRTAGGGMKCWGRNDSGQAGIGSTSSISGVVTPSGLASSVEGIGVGFFSSCSVQTGGGLRCFGWNTDGQLGFSPVSSVATPTAVSQLGSSAVAFAGGYNFSCALSSPSGSVSCAGRNNLGQLGIMNDTTSTSSYAAATVVPTGAVQIALGRATGYARLGDGSVRSWGANDKGQLGGGSTGGGVVSTSSSIVVGNLSPAVTFIAANELQACAVIQGGTVKCWGDNFAGQAGNGSTSATGIGTPETVVGLVVAQ